MKCRKCGRFMMDDEQAMELQGEIMASGASYEGRMSDINDINLCDYCLQEQADRDARREADFA